MHGKIVAQCVRACVGERERERVRVPQACCSKIAIWFEVTLQMKLHHPEEG